MKKIRISSLLLIIGLLFASCDTNDYQEAQFDGVGDVFVRCMKLDNDTVYAPIFYTYANENLSEVSVESPETEVSNYELSDFYEDKSVFRLLPEASDYSTTDITNGIYKFEVTSTTQEQLHLQDKLFDSRIELMNITNFAYTTEGHTFDISWNKLDNADTYIVKLLTKKDGAILYVSDRIATTEYKFNENSKNWNYGVNLTAGTTYWIGVYGYEFENSTNTNSSYINSETVEYKEIIW